MSAELQQTGRLEPAVQLLRTGTIVSALRAVSGFDGTGEGAPLTVLTFWAAGGLLLLCLQSLWAHGAGHRRQPGIRGAV